MLPRVRNLRRVIALVSIAGCGPVVSPSPEDGDGSGTSGSAEVTTIIMGSTSTTPDDSSSSDDDSISISSSSSSGSGEPFECAPLPGVPPGAEASWCSGDPSAIGMAASSYVGCLDGLVRFRQSWRDEEQSYLFYDVSAQFYTVLEDMSGEAISTILEPYDGTVDDCGLYEFGGDNELGDFDFEDENGITFTFGDFELSAQRSASGSVINYSANAADEGLQPQHLAPHGFVLADGQGDFSESVTLADPIVAMSPAVDGSGMLDRRALTITWEPSEIGLPLELRLQISEDDQPRYTLFCRMEDDGEFTVPEALACQLPPDEGAGLILARTDRAIVSPDDGRNIGVVIETSVRSSVALQ